MEIAMLHLAQGNYRLAAQACDVAGGSVILEIEDKKMGVRRTVVSDETTKNDEVRAILSNDEIAAGNDIQALLSDDETAAFELLRAYIWVSRYARLMTALRIARYVGGIWCVDDEPHNELAEYTVCGNAASPTCHICLTSLLGPYPFLLLEDTRGICRARPAGRGQHKS